MLAQRYAITCAWAEFSCPACSQTHAGAPA